jgi:hypothetical protein
MSRRTLTAGVLTGLSYLYKYRFLTISQFGRIAGFQRYHTAEVLRDLERWGMIGYFGYTGIPGHGRTPKVYFVKRKGFELLRFETTLIDETAHFSEVNKGSTWTVLMAHRLKIIDMLLAVEIALRIRPHVRMVNVFVEYRMVKRGGVMVRETTDFVDDEAVSENKLVPDAAFILENFETNKRRLFFLEVDMGTERIVSPMTWDTRATIKHKFCQYDRYLQSKRYQQTYQAYGQFDFFIMLFLTIGAERVDNIRQELSSLPGVFAPYYRITTFEKAMGDFLGPIWNSRVNSDTNIHGLVQTQARENVLDARCGP